jgi:hypothetical protein
MTSGDFPELRAAARESLIGSAVVWALNALRHAWSDAAITRTIGSGLAAARQMSPAEGTRALSIALATAAIAAWALSKAIPVYLGTSVPEWAWLFAAAVFAFAAVRPEVVAREWSRSGVRKFSLWLRES